MIRAIITDIEGTTSSISYVKDMMFPYSKNNLRDYLNKHWDILIGKFPKDFTKEDAFNTLSEYIEKDVKDTILKEIQGHIWEEGFLKGELRGHIYEDAYKILKHWHDMGIKLYVYSSGSIKAQKLFFAHTDYGDITYLFDGFFDTTIGHKKEPTSYINILKAIKQEPNDILFLSDVEDELKAAKEVGVNTILVCRDGMKSSTHKSVKDFYQVSL